MASANNASFSSNEDEDNVFSSQFAALLKPIRELTKQGCWDLNIASKLDEYIHYIAHLNLELNINGEHMKLDFAKAAMVVQNSVQIYSKKVENLWNLLQEVMEALSSHGNGIENNEEGQNPALPKAKRNVRRRHQRGDVDLLEPVALKFRKFSSKIKKKNVKRLKKIATLPPEILQLEEAVSSSNPLKIKLYTLSNEHLGYPSDLRSNFPFDPFTFFLKIEHSSVTRANRETADRSPDERIEPPLLIPEVPAPVVGSFDGLEEQPPDLDADWQNDEDLRLSDDSPPLLEPTEIVPVNEFPADRLTRLRQRAPLLLAENRQCQQEDTLLPWEGMDPYSNDEGIKKQCGQPMKYKLPMLLQQRKRKEVGKDPVEENTLIGIEEYLGHHASLKKPLSKNQAQPENEFWEDYVHFCRTIGSTIKKQRKHHPEGTEADESDDSTEQDNEIDDRNDDDNRNSSPDKELRSSSPDSGGIADFHFDAVGSPQSSPTREMDESKQYFQLIQQFMTEYTASAQNFVHSTESTRRVQAWHEHIIPRLQEAEERRNFDIHEYGSRILESFGEEAALGSQTTFGRVVHNEAKHEIARYFLATLQLANAYNVEINIEEELNMEGVGLKLLSRERHHEHMDDFMS